MEDDSKTMLSCKVVLLLGTTFERSRGADARRVETATARPQVPNTGTRSTRRRRTIWSRLRESFRKKIAESVQLIVRLTFPLAPVDVDIPVMAKDVVPVTVTLNVPDCDAWVVAVAR
jgi:hypothetical protein